MSKFQQTMRCFNDLEPEVIFNVTEFIRIFNGKGDEKINSKQVHSFLSPARRLGIVISGDITPSPKGRVARKEYLKVRSFTDEEIKLLSRRSDAIDFTASFKDIDSLMLDQNKVKSVKRIISSPSNKLTDAEIAKHCSVPHGFVSRVRSDMTIPKKKLYYKPKAEKQTSPPENHHPVVLAKSLPTTIDLIEDSKYYPVLGSSIKAIRIKLKNLEKTKAELLDELSNSKTAMTVLQEKLSKHSSDGAIDLRILME